MFLNESPDAIQFRLTEPEVVRHSNWRQPEFGELLVPLHVNVGRLVPVAGEEEKPIRTALQDGWTHRSRFCQLFGPTASFIGLLCRFLQAAHPQLSALSSVSVYQPISTSPHAADGGQPADETVWAVIHELATA